MSYATKPNTTAKKSTKKSTKKGNAMSAKTYITTPTVLQTVTTPAPVFKRATLQERALSAADVTLERKYEGSMLMTTLDKLLHMKRPHDGFNERNALGYILRNIPEGAAWSFDEVGNLHVDYRTHATNRTLFTAHVDTVHRDDGINRIRKTDSVWFADGSQLGADDGSGVAMLMHLMTNEVRAYYLFTIGEECGGIGATHVGKNNTELLSQFDRAIAFDRRGSSDIITHQSGGRCSSDAFAQALSDNLNAAGMLYMPCDGGVYTDTAEFIHVVPECTNISIGYLCEHSSDEAQDILHLRELADAVLSFDWDALPTERDPKAVEPDLYADWQTMYRGADHSHAVPSKTYDDSEWAKYITDEDYMYEVIDALTEAEQGSKANLARIMANSILPDDPAEAMHFVNQHIGRLTPALIEEAATSLYQGMDVDSVMCELYDELSN